MLNTLLRGAIASLFLLGSLSGAQATDEVLVRLAPNYATPEHAALLVQGWGKVLMREAPGSYRVVLNGRIPMPEALSRLAGRTGVESARRSWRTSRKRCGKTSRPHSPTSAGIRREDS